MIEASSAWKDRQQRFLLPESYVEISCIIAPDGLQDKITASGTTEAIFSDIKSVVGTSDTTTAKKYATLEQNIWALDGTLNILPDDEPYSNAGYVSNTGDYGVVTLTLPSVQTEAISGVTITWSSEHNEYPMVFTVTAKNGNTVVAEKTITDNTTNRSIVYMDIVNYNSVSVTIHNWCLPNHRPRIDSIVLGLGLVFTKNELISYTHEQSGSIVTAELPKNSISFTISNLDNQWNPNNPSGLEQYLSERQKLTVRYGLDIDGVTEWIKAGTFYLSEWLAPSNGLEASFVARDVLEFMMNEVYTGTKINTPYEIAKAAVEQANLPSSDLVMLDNLYTQIDTVGVIGENEKPTLAEVLQLCAHASSCVMYQNRDGVLVITPQRRTLEDYLIPLELAYSYPEIELSKKLKSIEVTYVPYLQTESFVYSYGVSNSGEVQTMNNPLITSAAAASLVASWVSKSISKRQIVSGEYRADPRLDVFDVVSVSSKFGILSPVVITNIKYTFNGAFKASYTGYVIAQEG